MAPISALPRPAKYPDVNLWADEAIWGHRFHNDQTPWLVLAEFMAVFLSRHRDGRALKEDRQGDQHEHFTYHIPRLMGLRKVVFNNPHILQAVAAESSEDAKWQLWEEGLGDQAGEYRCLRSRFETLNGLAHVIDFFQRTAIEAHRQRRWTSRFLFPYGRHCVYADLDGGKHHRPDRRFFARGGELLYLMLSRSGRGQELGKMIAQRLLPENEKWDRVARALLPDPSSTQTDNVAMSSLGYLPYAHRPEYVALAEDWRRLLDLELPGAALLDPLMRISTLHILRYMLHRAHEEADQRKPRFVLEVDAPRATAIRELSIDNLNSNRRLSTRAIHAYIDRAQDEDGWLTALSARQPAAAAANFLKDRFSWTADTGTSGNDPHRIFRSLRNYAEKRHSEHVAKVHTEWSRHVGLTISRRGVGTWYSPDDAFLKALVITTVDQGRIDFRRFLDKLYSRYQVVIGVQEAERAFGTLPADEKEFTLNTQRFEQRLRTLGLLRRLSDDCAYVENPFRTRP